MTSRRDAAPTLDVIERHCAQFRDLFDEVRTFENFQSLHLGLLAQLPRKSLPALARFLELPNPQRLHHLLTTPHLSTADIEHRRIQLLREALGSRPLTLMIDETGARKKGTSTDYVSRQYLGSLGKVDNGLVTVHLVALVGELTFPLCWRVFKPKSRLRDNDTHITKVSMAAQMLAEVSSWGLTIECVVADSAYGMASQFVRCVQKYGWNYALAIRSDFSLYLPADAEVWSKDWVRVTRHFNDGTAQERWAQEWVWGRERNERYIIITSDRVNQPDNETSFIRTNLSGERGLSVLADLYGSRTWVEATFRNMKTDLGWHDWRLTRWEHIERWMTMVLSVYSLVSLKALERAHVGREVSPGDVGEMSGHRDWRGTSKWCDVLHDLRVLARAFGALVALFCWLEFFSFDARHLSSSLDVLYQLPFL